MGPIATLELLPSGYYHFRLSREVWAQWPSWQGGPTRADCFNPAWTWPLIREAWERNGAELANAVRR